MKIIVKKFPFSLYNINSMEGYLENLSINGLILTGISRLKNSFEFRETPSQKIRYRILFSQANLSEETKTQLQQSGWDYIDSFIFSEGLRKVGFHFYKSENGPAEDDLINKINENFIMKLNPSSTYIQFSVIYLVLFLFLVLLRKGRVIEGWSIPAFIGFCSYNCFEDFISYKAKLNLKKSYVFNKPTEKADWALVEQDERQTRSKEYFLLPLIITFSVVVYIFIVNKYIG